VPGGSVLVVALPMSLVGAHKAFISRFRCERRNSTFVAERLLDCAARAFR